LTIPYTIDRPRPVPFPTSFVVKNASKMCGRAALAIPVPVSVTDGITYWPGCVGGGFELKHAPARHSVACIHCQIQDDLSELVRIEPRIRQFISRVCDELNVLANTPAAGDERYPTQLHSHSLRAPALPAAG
jgi:hypothetical protein